VQRNVVLRRFSSALPLGKLVALSSFDHDIDGSERIFAVDFLQTKARTGFHFTFQYIVE
jgi:hypothetical protein